MEDPNSTFLVISLNVIGLNTLFKAETYRLYRFDSKARPSIILSSEAHFKYKVANQTGSKRTKKNTMQTLIIKKNLSGDIKLDKKDFRW
jgi:hypothetical protein